MIDRGKKIILHYKLSVDGEVVESTEGKAPLEYTHGAKAIIPGLETALEGLKAGDIKTVDVAPEDAYGQVDGAAFKEFPKSSLPDNMVPQVGMVLQATAPDGMNFPAVISEVNDDTMVLNFNHPLAGRTLRFEVSIIDIVANKADHV